MCVWWLPYSCRMFLEAQHQQSFATALRSGFVSPSPFAGVVQAVVAFLGKVLNTSATGPAQAAAPRQACGQCSASTGHQLSRAACLLVDISEPTLSSTVLRSVFVF